MPRLQLLKTGFLLLIVLLSFSLFNAAKIEAQTSTPSPLICQNFVSTISNDLKTNACNFSGGNQVCGASAAVSIGYDPKVDTLESISTGEVKTLDKVQVLKTQGVNLEKHEWGVALLKVGTFSTGTEATRTATFMLYGDASLTSNPNVAEAAPGSAVCSTVTTHNTYMRIAPTNSVAPLQLLQENTTLQLIGKSANKTWLLASNQKMTGWIPASLVQPKCNLDDLSSIKVNAGLGGLNSASTLQSFYLSVKNTALSDCASIPPSGLVVQAPAKRPVIFAVNGATILTDGMVMLTATPNSVMQVVAIKGVTQISLQSSRRTLLRGQELLVPLGGVDGLDVQNLGVQPHAVDENKLGLKGLCQIAQSTGLNVPCELPKYQCTFTVAGFSSDQNPVELVENVTGAPKCSSTTLHWNVQGVDAVLLNGQSVPLQGSQAVCINQTTTYTLNMTCGGVAKASSYTLNFKAINK